MKNLYRALFPPTRPHVLLGRQLQPFSNWHLFQLRFAESPLVGFSGQIDLAALMIGAAVCVTRFPQRFAPVGWKELWAHRRALRRLRSIDWVESLLEGGLVLVKDELALAAEVAAWQTYVNDYVGRPRFFNRKAPRLCKMPAPLAMWASLKLRGFSKEDAWNEPVGEADWEKLAMAEAEGTELGEFVSDAAIKAMKASGWYDKLAPEDRP